MDKKTFYVTTPIYYPSGSLHIGHVYTTTLARTLANFKILNGYDAKMLTGADEHGQKIQNKAEELGIEPQQYVEQMSKEFKNLWELLEINYDYYSRTSNISHSKAVSQQFTQLVKKGDIVKGFYKGLYSVPDEEFVTKAQSKEEGGKYFHPISGHELKQIEEESYFFEMSKYENWWKQYVDDHPDFIIPNKILKELKNNFINKGLEDLSVTRSTFNWGISIEEDKKHVIYVWLDALNNYITALGYNSSDDSDYQKYWVNGDEIVHIVGKEITRFHGIYWPIILKASGIRQPSTILSHGWIVTPEGKMSKSKGNVVDPINLIKKYGAEEIKYFFSSQINMGQDGVFDEEILKNILNSELSNNYGNLLSRTIAMTLQNFENPIPYKKSTFEVDQNILKDIIIHKNIFIDEFDKYQINKGLSEIMKLGKKLNGYIDITKPWKLTEDKERLATVLNILLNGIYAMTTMLSVVIPKKAKQALDMLGIKEFSLDEINNFKKFDKILPIKGEILFQRIK